MLERRPHGISAPIVTATAEPTKPFLVLTVRVMTPMIGGGYQQGRIDPEQVVNAKAVRGHLRTWWRAVSAHRFASAEKLFEAESAVWGAAASFDDSAAPSHAPVQVEVDMLDDGRRVAIDRNNSDLPQYVMFPFTMGERAGLATSRVGVRFRLRLGPGPGVTLQRTDEREAIFAAWAWIAFGGIGSRTRRGCGSLFAESGMHRNNVLEFVEALNGFLVRQPIAGDAVTARLRGGYMALGEPQDHGTAWHEAVGRLQAFRFRKNDRGRVLNTQRTRADLGLPLGSIRGPNGETRMASPVIVKPLVISAERSLPMALVLDAPHVFADVREYRDAATGEPIRDQFMRDVEANWHTRRRNF